MLPTIKHQQASYKKERDFKNSYYFY